MVSVSYIGRLGNQMFQYGWARLMAERLGYRLQAPAIREFPATLEAIDGEEFKQPTIAIAGAFRLPFEEIESRCRASNGAHINITRSHFENAAILQPYRSSLRTWFRLPCLEPNPRLRYWAHGRWHRFDSAFGGEGDDLVINVRLGDYLKRELRARLLLFDYFDIILQARAWRNVFITSDSIDHPALEPFRAIGAIFFFQRSALDTLSFIDRFASVAISQSTFSWWAAYLSDANDVFFPIAKTGVWTMDRMSAGDHDLRVDEQRYHYVSLASRRVCGPFHLAFESSFERDV